MDGDKHKPKGRFDRWIDAFMDGMRKLTRKGSHRIPSDTDSKRYQRRWRRREGRAALKAQEKG